MESLFQRKLSPRRDSEDDQEQCGKHTGESFDFRLDQRTTLPRHWSLENIQQNQNFSSNQAIKRKPSFEKDTGTPVQLQMPPSRFGDKRQKNRRLLPEPRVRQKSKCYCSKFNVVYLIYLPLLLLPLVLKLALHVAKLRAVSTKQHTRLPSLTDIADTVTFAKENSRSRISDTSRKRAFEDAIASGPYRGRLNVVFIMSDQHRHDAMGRFFEEDNPEVAALTPNFNRLVDEGATFSNAFSYVPLCVPSRATLITGSPPEITNVWRGTDEEVDPVVATATSVLKENGYRAEFYGKWHNWEQGLERDYDASFINRHPDDLNRDDPAKLKQKSNKKHLKPTAAHSRSYSDWLSTHFKYVAPSAAEMATYHQFPTKRNKRAYDFPYTEIINFGAHVGVDGFSEVSRVKNGSILDFGNPGGQGVNGFVALPPWATESRLIANQTTIALRRLVKEKQFPFAITASFNKPHPPYIVSKYYFDKIWTLRDKLPLSRNVNSNFEKNRYPHTSPYGNKYPYYKSIANFFHQDPLRRRQLYALYLAGVMELDDCLGQILDTLDDLGLTQSTLVIYTSDHGDMLGDHGMLGKQVLYEESVRVPLIMRLPGTIEARASVARFASSLDIVPTILDFLINSGSVKTLADLDKQPLTNQAHNSLAGNSLRSQVLTRGAYAIVDDLQQQRITFGTTMMREELPGVGEEDFIISVEINSEHYMVRTLDWKMIFDVSRNESSVLFDMRRDGHENINLLATHHTKAREKYHDILNGLFLKLKAWQRHLEKQKQKPMD